MTRHEEVPAEDPVGMLIPVDYFQRITEKIVRGIFYIEDQKFIEPPYIIDFLVPPDEVLKQFEAWLTTYGVPYAREPGLVVYRAIVPDGGLTSVFRITFWESVEHLRDGYLRMRVIAGILLLLPTLALAEPLPPPKPPATAAADDRTTLRLLCNCLQVLADTGKYGKTARQ